MNETHSPELRSSMILRGFCDRPGAVRIGFGDASGTVAAH
jgi:hypothetical protein